MNINYGEKRINGRAKTNKWNGSLINGRLIIHFSLDFKIPFECNFTIECSWIQLARFTSQNRGNRSNFDKRVSCSSSWNHNLRRMLGIVETLVQFMVYRWLEWFSWFWINEYSCTFILKIGKNFENLQLDNKEWWR